ncbi:MAG: PAS domain S-box protein [Chloroflexota bacterium]
MNRRPRPQQLQAAEASLQQARQRFDLISHYTRDVIWTIEIDTQCTTFVSPAIQALTGYSPADLHEKRFDWLLTSASAARAAAALANNAARYLAGEPEPVQPLDLECRHKDGSIVPVEVTSRVTRDVEGRLVLNGIARDIRERRATELARQEQERLLAYHYRLVEILTTISTRLINLPTAEIDAEINRCLQQIGEFEEVDRSYVFQLDRATGLVSNTYEWCAPGIEPQIENLQQEPVSMTPWWFEKMERLEEIYIPCLTGLPAEAQAERELLNQQGIQSLLAVPLVINQQLAGFLGFDSVRRPRSWSSDTILLLRMAADIIANALLRRQSEAELRRSNASLQLISEHTRDMIWTLDAETQTFSYLSPSVEKLFGFRIADLINQSPALILTPASYAQIIPLVPKIIATFQAGQAEPITVELDQVRQDGTVFPIEVTAGYGVNEAGRLQIVGISRDITERRRAQEQLRRSEATTRAIITATQETIFLIDPLGNILATNPMGARRLGATVEEILNTNLFDYFPGEVSRSRYARLQQLLTGSKALSFEDQRSGRWYQHNWYPIQDENEKISHVVMYASDITERKQANLALAASEEKYRQLSAELEARVLQRTGELSAANAALEKANRLKDEFLASMSHELRTPLTGVLGLAEAMQMETYGTLNDRQLKALKNIESSGRHLLELINDILDLSKIGADKLDMHMAPCPVDDICQAALQLTRGMAQARRQSVSYSSSPPGAVVQADPRRLKQMLVNLLSNAAKFTPEHGSFGLEVTGDEAGQALRLSVWDTGIGIKPEDLERLFQPFVQLDSSLARQYSGTGLGLSLVARLAEKHGGSVRVESTPGQGSRFTITLPWEPEQEPTGAADGLHRRAGSACAPARHAQPPPGPAPEAVTILVTDDNEVILENVGEFLRSRAYRVITARNGREMVDQVQALRPALVIADVQMPGMDGLAATRAVRALPDPALARLPVIAMTALAMPGDEQRCLDAGADVYISKPISLLNLAQLVQQLLAR